MHTPDPNCRAAGGFTLIELLVVLAIIALLLTIGARGIGKFMGEGEIGATKARVQELKLLLDQHRTSAGDYPPSRLERYGVKAKNAINEGCEALVIGLMHKDYKGARIDETYLADLESDVPDKNVTTNPRAALLEVVDSWNNPFVYIRYDDYGREQDYEFVEELTGEAVVATATAEKNELTGDYHAKESYQLRSVGPDGIYGTEDDITSFR